MIQLMSETLLHISEVPTVAWFPTWLGLEASYCKESKHFKHQKHRKILKLENLLKASILLQRVVGYKAPLLPHLARKNSGEREIRTLETIARLRAFQARALSLQATSPKFQIILLLYLFFLKLQELFIFFLFFLVCVFYRSCSINIFSNILFFYFDKKDIIILFFCSFIVYKNNNYAL